MNLPVLILGAGGNARVCIEMSQLSGREVLGALCYDHSPSELLPGDGAIIAAGSVVIRDVGSMTLVAGMSASVKRVMQND